ncbi:MAG: hypothetical protein AB1635_13440 [Acidobacteriota bacterium]
MARPAVALVGLLVGLAVLAAPHRTSAIQPTEAPASPALTIDEQERFLASARVVRARRVDRGVTGTLRATLTDGRVTHDASLQFVDLARPHFQGTQGTELNFKDSWRFNVAAYRLARLLGIRSVPPSVEREWRGRKGSFTWWIDDVQMDEGERLRTAARAPDAEAWNRQIWKVRVFDQLVENVDRNTGNLLIDRAWTIWMIDHSRAFRSSNRPPNDGHLRRCPRPLYDALKALDEVAFAAAVRDYLTPWEIRAVLARRAYIVARLEATPGAIVP